MVRSSPTPPHPPQHRIHLCRRVTPRSMSPIIVNMGGERRGEKSRVQGNNAITGPRLEVWDLKPDTQTTTLPRFHSERLKKLNWWFLFTNPFDMRNSTSGSLELSIARMRGVPPLMVCASISAPLSSSSWTRSTCPEWHAWCNGLHLKLSLALTSALEENKVMHSIRHFESTSSFKWKSTSKSQWLQN